MNNVRKGGRIARNGYRAIVSSIQARIESGDIPLGTFLPTERELQEDFGAARSTIRKVLATLVEQGWAQAVPNKGVVAGRGLRPAPSKEIAFIGNGTFVHQVLEARFRSFCNERGYNLVSIGGTSSYPMKYALQRVLDAEYAGALVFCFDAFPDPEVLAQLSRQLPIVALDHRLGASETDLVTFDHEAAAYETTSHLIRQGASRVGLTGMLDTLDATNARFRGYMRAMFDHGLKPNPADFAFTLTSGRDVQITDLLEARLRSISQPDALFVLQDVCVPSVVECALRVGLSIPHDLRLATLGDEIDVSVDGVGMTACAFDWEVLAQEAFALLADRLANLHSSPMVRIAPHRLVVRGLCGAPREQWSIEPDRLTGFQGGLPLPRSNYRYQARWSVERSAEPELALRAIQ